MRILSKKIISVFIVLGVIYSMSFGGLFNRGNNSTGSGNSGSTGSTGSTESSESSGSSEGSGENNSGDSGKKNKRKKGNSNNNSGEEEPLPTPNYDVTTGSGAIGIASEGGNLGTVSTSALREGIQECGNNSDMADAKAAMEAELHLRETVGENYLFAIRAEDSAAKAAKKYVAEKSKLDAIRDKMAAMEESFGTHEKGAAKKYAELCKEYNEQRKAYESAKKEKNRAAAQMQAAYNRLGAAYNQAGDPVRIGNGNYIAEYEDYKAVDKITNYEISRNLNYSGTVESFGENWSCSLDSRLVFARTPDYEEFLKLAYELEEQAEIAKQVIIDYRNETLNTPDEELDGYFAEITEAIDGIKDVRFWFKEQVTNGKVTDVMNQSVMYGRYSNLENRVGEDRMIYYLDDEGVEHAFSYDSNSNSYIGVDEFTNNEMTLRFEKSLGGFDLNNQEYVISYKNGTRKYFSYGGVLKKRVDRNGNVITYETGSSGRIESVILPTGEKLSIQRSNGLITSITGETSGTTKYSYEGNKLCKVIFQNGVVVSYFYNASGALKGIRKADGSNVQIEYENDASLNSRCISVVDDNDNKEEFIFDGVNQVTHITADGYTELFKFNDFGNVIYKKDFSGVEHIFENDDSGRVKTLRKGNALYTYQYDSAGLLSNISCSDGNKESYSYNAFGDIRSYTDGDGFNRTYNYDANGNVIRVYSNGVILCSCTYLSNGLLDSLQERGSTYKYNYNRFGQMTKRSWINEYNEVFDEVWNYDSQGRISFHKDYWGKETLFTYGTFYEKESNPLRSIEHFYDNRGREVKTVITDLKSGKKYTNTVLRDGLGNIKKLLLDGYTYKEYEYYADCKIKSEIVWNNLGKESDFLTEKQGVKTEFSYSTNGQLQSIQKSFCGAADSVILCKKDYSPGKNGFEIKEYTGDMIIPDVYLFDSKERLISEKKKDGFEKNYSYSKAGRLLKISDTNGNDITYSYNSNGTYSVKNVNKAGGISITNYDAYGHILRQTDYEGNEYSYTYDKEGLLKEVRNPDSKISCKYDKKGRLLEELVYTLEGDLFYSKNISYDDKSNTKIVRVCENPESKYFYNGFGQLVKLSDSTGNRLFEYNGLGNLVSYTNGAGVKYKYEYSATGKVTYEESSDGDVIFYKYDALDNLLSKEKNGFTEVSLDYDLEGRLTDKYTFPGHKEHYEYDSVGLMQFSSNDTGSLTYNINNSTLKITDGKKSSYEYKLGLYGNVIEEINPLGNKAFHKYDKNGRVIYRQRFSGLNENISYDYKNKSVTRSFSNGEEIKITRNLDNSITELESKEDYLHFNYNFNGLLSEVYNKVLDFTVSYSYDAKGNCIEKKSDAFDFVYKYNNKGLLIQVDEKKSGYRVEIDYDTKSREISRKYSNGIRIEKTFNNLNLVTSLQVKNSSGLLLTGEYVLYDDFGRKKCKANEKGEFTLYEYDSNGKLIKVIYPYSQEQIDFSRNEAIECGLNLKDYKPDGVFIELDSKDKSLLEALCQTNNWNQRQYSWVEEYEYSPCGSVSSVKNGFGKLYYFYDSANRLICKSTSSEINTSKGQEFLWDADGNLLKICSKFGEISFTYGIHNRPVEIKKQEFLESGDRFEILSFEYDALGRRSREIINGTTQYEYIYDGLSNQVLYKVPVTINEISIAKYWSENQKSGESRTGKTSDGSSFDVRTFALDENIKPYDDTKLVLSKEDDNESKRMQKGKENFINNDFDSRPCSLLYLLGLPAVAKYEDGYNFTECEYYCPNVNNQLAGVFDQQGNCISYSDYDVWGNSFSGGKMNSYSFGNVLHFSNYTIYSLGKRDYIPLLKSFTTEDPIRNGSNWFAYAATDPVNYFDFSGMYKDSCSQEQNAYYYSGMAYFITYDEEGGAGVIIKCGIPTNYDCADTSATADYYAAAYAGMDSYSDMADSFADNFTPGEDGYSENNRKARDSTSSRDYYDSDGDSSSVRQTSSDINDLQNPDYICPGTIIVFEPGDGASTGHTITVLAREFENVNNPEGGFVVIGFVNFEGHMNADTEIGYVYVNDQDDPGSNCWNIRRYRGVYAGTYEIEGSDRGSYDGPKCIV